MTNQPQLPDEAGLLEESRLDQNIMYFGRVLRQAGLPVGPGKILDAIEAVRAVGLENRQDFYWTLQAVFVNRHNQFKLFDQAFHFFWRNPKLLERMMGMLLPAFKGDEILQEEEAVLRRIAEALQGQQAAKEEADDVSPDEETEVQLDASLTFSASEQLAEKDFEKMSLEELARSKAVLKKFHSPFRLMKTRRFQRHARGSRIDMRASLRASAKRGGDMIYLHRKKQKELPPPLVVLCDISGSMERYSRIILFFLHMLANDRDRMHSFLFGTQLSNITRDLRYRDPDEALDRIGRNVRDWSGGTRIGATLHAFNRDWSRRVLAQGATVLIITDGLDREGAEGISREMERLHKSCKKLIWLNPLLRFDQYEPKSGGARAMMAHVDEFRPVHNLVSLAQLAQALELNQGMNQRDMSRWRERAR